MMSPTSVFASPGEAAYAQAKSDEENESTPPWSEADQEMWENAAYGAIANSKQIAAAAQVAYFTRNQAVPYYVGEGQDQGKVFTARLTEPGCGTIEICVDGVLVRTLLAPDEKTAIEWFETLVRTPPGWVCTWPLPSVEAWPETT